MTQKRQTGNPSPTLDVVVLHLSFFSWLRDTTRGLHKREQLKVDSVMKGTGLYLANRESDDVTSSFVATRTNLFLS